MIYVNDLSILMGLGSSALEHYSISASYSMTKMHGGYPALEPLLPLEKMIIAMSNSGSGAVFFLGNRAHYQVLDQPDSQYDSENGNTQTVYQNSSVQDMWQYDNCNAANDWNCCDDVHVPYESDKPEPGIGVKRRIKRRQSEAMLCEEEMKPAALNKVQDNDVKLKPKRITLLSFLSSLARRKRPDDVNMHGHTQLHLNHLDHLESALTACTYRESCRCLDCQSRYFECDEADSEYDYSDDSDFLNYASYASGDVESGRFQPEPDEYDDEVFSNSIPEDNTSTDLLLEGREKMSISSDTLEAGDDEDDMQLEVAAGTPVVLNHLLTHPIACVIQ